MKTRQKISEKEFDSVRTFRKIKEKISKDIYGKTIPNPGIFKKAKGQGQKYSDDRFVKTRTPARDPGQMKKIKKLPAICGKLF